MQETYDDSVRTAFSAAAKASSEFVQQKVVEHKKVLVRVGYPYDNKHLHHLHDYPGGCQWSSALHWLGNCRSCYLFCDWDALYCSQGRQGSAKDQL